MAALNDEAHALKMMVKLLTTLTESLGKVEENLSLVAEFYKGDLSAPKPSKKMRLENVVNTHKNGIDKILVKLAKTLKTVHWSKYPRPEMKKCCDAVESLFTRDISAMRDAANNQVSEEKCLDSTGNETLQNNGELAHQQNRGRRNRYPKAVEDEIWDWASRPCYELDRERNGVPCRDVLRMASEWCLLSHIKESPRTVNEFVTAYRQIRRKRL